MKTILHPLSILLMTLLLSCSMQSKFTRQFKGKTKTELDAHFCQQGTVTSLSPGKSYVAYTQTKILRSVPVNKGVTTLDPMVSPSVEKKLKYIFYLDKDGKVTECKYDAEYLH